MKSGWLDWLERIISLSLDLFKAVLGRVQFPSVSANIRILEIWSNFKKFPKILKLASEKLYSHFLRGFCMVEYLSNLREKLTVRKVKSCSFRPVLQSFS